MKSVLKELTSECIDVSSSRLVHLLSQWPERGLEPLTQCLRASTTKTRTHGFFVALLEKHSDVGNKEPEPALQMRSVLGCGVMMYTIHIKT